ncbi:Leucine-rich repeat-containing N-terminal, plant-type [Sesbania bispinosa]|nr:Leucine-rich repeat-containing N-terminal, plant-type [Sesbania bispinosa]
MGLVFLLCFLFHPFALFFTTHHANALNASIPNDALSLLSFKQLVSSDPSNLLEGWTNRSTLSLCRWHGVTCGGDGRVTALHVTGLQGGELAPSVGDMSELRVLSIPETCFPARFRRA